MADSSVVDIPDRSENSPLVSIPGTNPSLFGRRRMSLVQNALATSAPLDRPALGAVLSSLQESDEDSTARLFLNVTGILGHVIGSALFLCISERWSLVDSIYFCIVTMTTVGYGDLTPKHAISKLFVVSYIVVSLVLISSILANLVEAVLDQQEEVLLERFLSSSVSEETTATQFSLIQNQQHNAERMQQDTFIVRTVKRATKGFHISDFYALAFSTLVLCAILVLGVVSFVMFEDLGFVDALYATVVSASTVGYGDYSPLKPVSRSLMTVWLIFSTVGLVKVVADFTDATVKAKQRVMTARLLSASMDRGTFFSMDMNNDGFVDKGEFLGEMLIRMGKVEREEVATLIAKFHELDKDNSGRIGIQDLQPLTAQVATS